MLEHLVLTECEPDFFKQLNQHWFGKSLKGNVKPYKFVERVSYDSHQALLSDFLADKDRWRISVYHDGWKHYFPDEIDDFEARIEEIAGHAMSDKMHPGFVDLAFDWNARFSKMYAKSYEGHLVVFNVLGSPNKDNQNGLWVPESYHHKMSGSEGAPPKPL